MHVPLVFQACGNVTYPNKSHPSARHTNYGPIKNMKQQKFIVSLFWRLKVHIQGARRSQIHLKPVGELFLASLYSLVVLGKSLALPYSWLHISNLFLLSSSSILPICFHIYVITFLHGKWSLDYSFTIVWAHPNWVYYKPTSKQSYIPKNLELMSQHTRYNQK